jgi:hypothetical protein
MGETVGQLALVGQQDQAGGVDVQPPHRIQALGLRNQGYHGRAALRVAGARYDARRLVERVDDPLVRARYRAAVDRHRLAGADVASRIGDRVAVDRDPAGAHDRLGRAPRGHAGGG